MSSRILLLLLMLYSCTCFSQDLIPYKTGDLYGYSNEEGIMQIQPSFEHAERFNGSGYAVVEYQGHAMLIDSTGTLLRNINGLEHLNGEFDEISGYRSRFFFKKGAYRGVMDSILRFTYVHKGESAYISEDPYYLRISKKIGKKSFNAIINIEGDTIFPYRLPAGKGSNCKVFSMGEHITICYENRHKGVNFYRDRRYVFIDSIYQKINFEYLEKYGFIVCEKPDNTMDIINEHFEFIYSNFNPNDYSNTDFFKDNNAWQNLTLPLIIELLNKNRKYHCSYNSVHDLCVCFGRKEIFANGKLLLDKNENYLHILPNLGIFLYEKGKEKGVRNLLGEDIIPLTMDRIIFSSGLKKILIAKGGKYTFHTTKGEKISTYDFANPWVLKEMGGSKFAIHRGDGIPITEFKYDTLITMNNGADYFGLINGKYNQLDSLGRKNGSKYDNVRWTRDYVLTENGGKKGIIHIKKWEEFIVPQYDEIEVFSKYPYIFLVEKDGKKLLVNSTNKVLNVDPREVKKFIRKKLPDGFTVANLRDKSTAYFSPEGEIIVIPNIRKRWTWYDERKKYPDYFSKGSHYVNYKTGLRYLDD